jgi:nitrogen fixation protein FixH
MLKKSSCYTFALALSATIASFAAEAHDPKAKHGGRIVAAGNYHVELVTKGTSVEAFIVDHDDKPVRADGYKGMAILVVDGKSQRVPLAPAGDNRLKGDAPSNLPANPKGVIQITNSAGATSNAKFN